MNNILIRKIAVTASFTPLSDVREVCSFELSAPPDNGHTVYVHGDDGSDVPLIPGEFHQFTKVNLQSISVKGTAGDIVTIYGGTW